MPNTPNFFKTDLLPFVGKYFGDTFNECITAKAFMQLFGTTTNKSKYYDLFGGEDFPEIPIYDGTMTEITPKRGFRTQLSTFERLGAYSIEEAQWEEDWSGECRKAGKRMGDAAAQTIMMDALRLWQGAFTGKKGGDGKCWAAADHPVASKGTKDGSREYEADPDAGTFSNLFTQSLTAAGIDALRTAASDLLTPAGKPYFGEFDTLVISPKLEPTAKKLLGATAQLRPTKNPDDDKNAASSITDMKGYIVAGGGGIGLVNNQWALIDSRKLKEALLIYYNRKPEVREAKDPNPYKRRFVAYARYDMMFGDARAVMFSNPS